MHIYLKNQIPPKGLSQRAVFYLTPSHLLFSSCTTPLLSPHVGHLCVPRNMYVLLLSMLVVTQQSLLPVDEDQLSLITNHLSSLPSSQYSYSPVQNKSLPLLIQFCPRKYYSLHSQVYYDCIYFPDQLFVFLENFICLTSLLSPSGIYILPLPESCSWTALTSRFIWSQSLFRPVLFNRILAIEHLKCIQCNGNTGVFTSKILIGVLNSFAFNLIIKMVGLKSFILVFILSHLFFSPLFLLFWLLLGELVMFQY